jgi:hypothetical protein
MVTILEPRQATPVESAPAPKATQPKPETREWSYSMPFAGVRYFSFQPAQRPAAPMPDPETTRPTLTATLIDERVILL